jgi:hypothetical protein
MGFPGNHVGLVLAAALTRTLLVACDGKTMGHAQDTHYTHTALAGRQKVFDLYLRAHRCNTASKSCLLAAHSGLGHQSHFESLADLI